MRNLNRQTVELLLLTIIAVLLFQSGVLIFLFCVPLQVLFVRQGKRGFLLSSLLFIAAILVWNLISAAASGDSTFMPVVIGMDAGLAFLFILGLGIVNLAPVPFGRTLYAVLAAAGVVTLISIPLIFVLKESEELSAFLRNQVAIGMRLVTQVSDPATGTPGVESEEFAYQLDQILTLIRDGFFQSYVFVYLAFLAGSIRSGTVIGKRSIGQEVSGIWTFRLPEFFIWPFIICGGGVLLSLVMNIGPARYPVWNGAFIMLFLYGIQGMGILQFLAIRKQVSAGMRLLAIFGICMLLFVPRVNLLVYVGIPILGVSEIWIRYRIAERS